MWERNLVLVVRLCPHRLAPLVGPCRYIFSCFSLCFLTAQGGLKQRDYGIKDGLSSPLNLCSLASIMLCSIHCYFEHVSHARHLRVLTWVCLHSLWLTHATYCRHQNTVHNAPLWQAYQKLYWPLPKAAAVTVCALVAGKIILKTKDAHNGTVKTQSTRSAPDAC